MAELDQNQTDTGTAEATPTPLVAILDTSAADVPAQSQEAEFEPSGTGEAQVPLKALRKERERRQKADKYAEELRAELERFDNAKYGFDEPQIEERLAAADASEADPGVQNYERSRERHKAEEDKINAGLRRLNAEQQGHVQHFVKTLSADHPDPVAAIRDYVNSLGLLDFKGTPIDQVLAQKDQPPQPDTSQLDRQIAELNRHGQEVAQAERRANFAACKADFVSEYGKAAYATLDQMSTAFVQSGHPAVQQYAQAVASSPDPVSTAARILYDLSAAGVWQPPAQQQAPQQQAPIFPSNLANRRNVGQRAGPGYSGPRPLEDIFRH